MNHARVLRMLLETRNFKSLNHAGCQWKRETQTSGNDSPALGARACVMSGPSASISRTSPTSASSLISRWSIRFSSEPPTWNFPWAPWPDCKQLAKITRVLIVHTLQGQTAPPRTSKVCVCGGGSLSVYVWRAVVVEKRSPRYV